MSASNFDKWLDDLTAHVRRKAGVAPAQAVHEACIVAAIALGSDIKGLSWFGSQLHATAVLEDDVICPTCKGEGVGIEMVCYGGPPVEKKMICPECDGTGLHDRWLMKEGK